MKTLELNGTQLSFECQGAGPSTLAFVHGWCSKAAHWDRQVDHFAVSRRVVRWDRRGMGASPGSADSATAQQHADDLAALLDHLDIEKVSVVGHAGGGPSALTFAVRHADRASGLIMVDTRLHKPAPAGEVDVWVRSLQRSIENLASPERFRQMYAGFFGPRADPAVVEDAILNALATPLDIAAAEIRQMASDTVGLAGHVRCPVLWVSAIPGDTKAVQDAFGDAMIGHVVGSGHFVQLEVAEQLNPMIEAFLTDRVDVGASAPVIATA